MICPSCGTWNKDESLFCKYCGFDLSKAPRPVAPPAPAPVPLPPAAAPPVVPRLFELPVHPSVTPEDIATILAAVERLATPA